MNCHAKATSEVMTPLKKRGACGLGLGLGLRLGLGLGLGLGVGVGLEEGRLRGEPQVGAPLAEADRVEGHLVRVRARVRVGLGSG